MPAQGENAVDFAEYKYKFITGIFSSAAIDGNTNTIRPNPYAALCVKECPQ